MWEPRPDEYTFSEPDSIPSTKEMKNIFNEMTDKLINTQEDNGSWR